MRIPQLSSPFRAPVIPIAAFLVSASLAGAQEPTVDTYWQRQSGSKYYAELEPFRKPDKHVQQKAGRLNDLMHDLRAMMRIATAADQKTLSYDQTGRQVCSDPKWSEAYERVKATSLNMEGWLGKVFLEDGDVGRRRVAAYGMFYFNDPQNVFHLISYLPAEPNREIREDGFQRAVQFLKVHLPESKPQNPKFPDNGIVVPRYDFNPLPFMQLLRTDKKIDQAQALWFLTEVLRCRRDLGKVYLDEIRDVLPGLLTAESNMLRVRSSDFLAAVDTKPGRAPGPDAPNEDRIRWFKQLDHELFPPIRHVSTGLVELYPSKDLDEVIRVGKRLLADADSLPHSSEPVGSSTRYGVRVNAMPAPLDRLGIPRTALIVSINAGPTRNKAEFEKRIGMFLDQTRKAAEEYERHVREAKAKGKEPRPPGIPSIQVEYIYKGKPKMREFRLR